VAKKRGRPLKAISPQSKDDEEITDNLTQSLNRKRKNEPIEEPSQNSKMPKESQNSKQKNSASEISSQVIEKNDDVEIEDISESKSTSPPKDNPTSKSNSIIPHVANQELIVIAADDEFSPKTYGSYDNGDLPRKLLTARQGVKPDEVNCLVEWNQRKNGIKPMESFVSNKILREKCPNLLLDFYESRLRFPTNK